MKNIFLIILNLFLLVQIFSVPALAEKTETGIVLTPAFQEIVLDHETKQKEFTVSVTNGTKTALYLRVSVLDFGSLDESGGVAFLGATGDLERKYALASWMRPERDVLTLDVGEMSTVRVTIENRESLSPGGHYGALLFENMGDKTISGGSTVSINQVFSTLVFVKKIGGEIYDLSFIGEEYSTNPFVFPEKMGVRFQNRGNIHLVPRGIVKIMNPFGQVVKKGIINEESGPLLPETIRTYPVRLKELGRALIPGFYIREVAYRYDGYDEFYVMTKRFFFLPMPAIIFFLILTGVFGWYVVRRRRSSSEKKSPSSVSSTEI